MRLNHWISWEGRVDLIAKTDENFDSPNLILHAARMVHTPQGSAPSAMIFWQPDPTTAPLAFGVVSHELAVARYIAEHIFIGTPFERAPAILGEIAISIDQEHASARVEIADFLFKAHLSEFSEISMIHRASTARAPFAHQGLEATAGHACLKINGEKVPFAIPTTNIAGEPRAVLSACGHYAG